MTTPSAVFDDIEQLAASTEPESATLISLLLQIYLKDRPDRMQGFDEEATKRNIKVTVYPNGVFSTLVIHNDNFRIRVPI